MQSWPSGAFGLPQTIYGCSYGANIPWIEGKLTFITGESQIMNTWSDPFHLRGPYSSYEFSIAVCSKLEGLLSEWDTRNQPPWPPGSYCIYQIATECPEGMTIKVLLHSTIANFHKGPYSSCIMSFSTLSIIPIHIHTHMHIYIYIYIYIYTILCIYLVVFVPISLQVSWPDHYNYNQDQQITNVTDPVPVTLLANNETYLQLCCRSDAPPSTYISLPTPDPFMLIKVNINSCSL